MSAVYNSEYTQSSVSSSGCNYARLGCYYGPRSTMPPIRRGTTSGVMIVPTYGAIGYNALTHGVPDSCGGHFNITNAYGANAGSCSTKNLYTKRLCGGCQQ